MDLCDKANVKTSTKYNHPFQRLNLISDIIIAEYGNDMLIHWIDVETKIEQLRILHGADYVVDYLNIIQFEKNPILEPDHNERNMAKIIQKSK